MGTADIEQLVHELAEALFRFDTADSIGLAGHGYEDVADALLPVVHAHARRVAADELRAAASEWAYLTERTAPVRRFLRARAAELTAPEADALRGGQ